MDLAFLVTFRILEAMFVVGLAGCLLVVPVTAVKLFGVLLEHDTPEEATKEGHAA
jgi:hypothetical protein